MYWLLPEQALQDTPANSPRGCKHAAAEAAAAAAAQQHVASFAVSPYYQPSEACLFFDAFCL